MEERVPWRHPPTEVRCAGTRYFFVERRHVSPTSTSTGNAKGAGAALTTNLTQQIHSKDNSN